MNQSEIEPRPRVVWVVFEHPLEDPLGFADFAFGEQTFSA
jgi:hypothetical protein